MYNISLVPLDPGSYNLCPFLKMEILSDGTGRLGGRARILLEMIMSVLVYLVVGC